MTCLFQGESTHGPQGVVVLGGSVYSYIEGRKCYKSLTEIKDDIDVAVFVLPSPTVIDTFFTPEERVKRPKRGGLSILTQSGSFAELIMDEMASEGIDVARIVSYGNRVDVGETDCLNFLTDERQRRLLPYTGLHLRRLGS